MRNIGLLIVFVLILLFSSCDKTDMLDANSEHPLTFSIDTLSFDTLFTGFPSTTQAFKIYNSSSKRVKIHQIYLQEEDSPFRINVNGTQGNQFNNIEIEPKDSLFVFAEVDLQAKNEDKARLLTDMVIFDVNAQLRGVVLEAWAQDVNLINSNIRADVVWSSNRPYLIEKEILVNSEASLNIEEGCKVYFRKNSGLDIKGRMNINGSFESPVIFSGSRLEDLYNNVPGQWNGIHFLPDSKSDILTHFTLKNGINGFIYEGTDLNRNTIRLNYARVKNFSQKGISLTNCNLTIHDVLVTNCGGECIDMGNNSRLEIYHSSVFNSWYYSIRTTPLIRIADGIQGSVDIVNSIIWGSQRDELELSSGTDISIENCLIKLGDTKQSEFDAFFTNCIFNQNPEFVDDQEFDFRLTQNSPCIDTGLSDIANDFPIDLNGNSRLEDSNPDLGAFEYKPEIE